MSDRVYPNVSVGGNFTIPGSETSPLYKAVRVVGTNRTIEIGGEYGWRLSGEAVEYQGYYTVYALKGDTLWFHWKGVANVYRLQDMSTADAKQRGVGVGGKGAYDSCSMINATQAYETGTKVARITVPAEGRYYYSSKIGGHCSNGMKIAVHAYDPFMPYELTKVVCTVVPLAEQARRAASAAAAAAATAAQALEARREAARAAVAEHALVVGAQCALLTVPVYEVQVVTTSASSGNTNGQFKLTLGGQTTASIPSSSSAADFQTRLNALSTVSGAVVTVSPNPLSGQFASGGYVWTVTFGSGNAGDVAALSCATSGAYGSLLLLFTQFLNYIPALLIRK